MAGQNKSTFDPQAVLDKVMKRGQDALDRSLVDAIADMQVRISSGRGTDGTTYKYSKQTAEKKGKSSPVDWTDTGTLRRSIDFLTKLSKNNIIEGLIGVKDLKRGRSSNGQILRGLIEKFPKLWGLSNQEIKNLYANFNKYFKS